MTVGENTNTFVVRAPESLLPPWDETQLRVDVEESNTLPAVAQLRFPDPHRKLLQDTGIRIGRPLTVHVKPGDGSGELPLFDGEVVSLEAEYDKGEGSFTTIRAMDRSHRLQRGRRVRGFVGRKASEIAREVAAAAGVPVGRIDPTATAYPLRTQANVTDWEFLAELAGENDREMGVKDGKFFFRAPVPAASAPNPSGAVRESPVGIEMGENVLFVRSSVTAVNQTAQVAVRGWDVKRKKSLHAQRKVTAGDGLRIGLTPPDAVAPFERSRPSETLLTDFPYRTDAEVKAVSTAAAAELADSVAELEVVVLGNPRLRVGTPVLLDRAGKPFDGKYTVTASRHTYRPGAGYETWVTVSGRQDRTPYGLVSGASAAARSPRVPGVAVGVVTDVQAPREHRNQGWVRLKLPWLSDDSGREKAYVTDWVRTVQLGGTGGGGVFSPEVNDEVLVAFEQGLLDRPYVIGGLYNGVDKPTPDSLALVDGRSGRVNRRSFASRGGHRVELLDAVPGPAGVRLRTHRDRLSVHLDQQNTVITVHSDGKVTVSAQQEVTVTGRGITLDAGSGELKLTGRSVSVNARRGMELNGGTSCSVNARIVEIN
ncbi:VgrG-related protein [Streptomyces sp. TRM 70361]|uniref:VgrG-related protein n=1 Tax=Streptomyces sp. TRM 70361 TaxID=3116553 RepID=UPI002E7BE95B|nr:VgrG-related protein [Streptomyces sp. TRM 70361]MEE1940293.1 VgrG-related protein [Streptomyces sp. TRM 70361]